MNRFEQRHERTRPGCPGGRHRCFHFEMKLKRARNEIQPPLNVVDKYCEWSFSALASAARPLLPDHYSLHVSWIRRYTAQRPQKCCGRRNMHCGVLLKAALSNTAPSDATLFRLPHPLLPYLAPPSCSGIVRSQPRH